MVTSLNDRMINDDDLNETVVRHDHDDPTGTSWLMYNATSLAEHLGIASELITCPTHGTREGILAEGSTPGTPRDFNAGKWTRLRCGCTLV